MQYELVEASTFSESHDINEEMSYFIDDVRDHLFQWHHRGLKLALLTLINVEGSSPRPIGSQMLVNENGAAVGLLSGGCVESALISEAVECLSQNTWKLIRYGRDSDYFDIKLPCGSGIDILITPISDPSFVDSLKQVTDYRQPISVSFDLQKKRIAIEPISEEDYFPKNHRGNQWTRSRVEEELHCFRKVFIPKQRVIAVGQGAVFNYFVTLSQSFDIELIAYSSGYSKSEESVHTKHTKKRSLKSPSSVDTSCLDSFSAMVLLSHDHDWDIPILTKALNTQVSYISALGSKATHQQRLALLAFEGVSVEDQARVKGPAGINIGGNTPPEIALSILSEIVAVKNHSDVING